MFRRDRIRARTGGSGIGVRLLAFLLLLGAAFSAQAVNCSDPPYNGVIDGNVVPFPDAQIQIDMNCTIRNYPASNPLNTNFSFYQPGGNVDKPKYLVVFDNVVHTGNMSCNATHEHKIWFTNGSSTKIQEGCQNLLIPVEKIDKQSPAATATVGVPFTYTMTIPVLFDPATQAPVPEYIGVGSNNTLHSAAIWDDLTATGADLTFVSINAYYKDTLAPVTLIPEDRPQAPSPTDLEENPDLYSYGGIWTPKNLSYKPIPLIEAGDQIVVEITVVLDDTPANSPGTQFVNTAKWQFGRLIDDVFYTPLPGEWGVSAPMTIVAPNLVVTKDGPDLLGGLNLGEWGEFTIDVWNSGESAGDAWNITILDRLPSSPTNNPPFSNGGMCELTPEVLSVTLAGNPLTEGNDYSLEYTGASCELKLILLDAAGPLGPDEHLIVTYQTKLDANSENGAVLTNVAVATQWFNDASNTGTNRVAYSCPLPYDGTPDTEDCQDVHAVMVALSGLFFEKTAEDPDTGQIVSSAMAGDTLRYTLRLRSIDEALDGLTFYDDLGALNALPVFVPGSLTLVSYPPGADVSNTAPNAGTNGAGILDIRGLSVPAGETIEIKFDITLQANLDEGTVVLNQADLIRNGSTIALSDDPNINGQANPAVEGDEDPTRVVIYVPVPPSAPLKEALQPTATIGEHFTYHITVPGTPSTSAIYDVQIHDNLALAGVDLKVVSIDKVSGSGSWVPVNLNNGGDQDTNLVIGDAITGIDIPVGQQIVIAVTVELLNTESNERPLPFSNTASYTYNTVKGDDMTSQAGGTSPSADMTVVEPVLTMSKTVVNVTSGKAPNDPAAGGDVLEYTLTITNGGDAIAQEINITDILPPELVLVPGSATAEINGGGPFTLSPPATIAPNTLVWGRGSDDEIDIPVGGVLVFKYRVTVQELTGASLANNAWVDWTSLDGAYPAEPAPGRERTGAGCGLGTVTAPNEYCVGPVTALLDTDDTNAIAKVVIGDSWDSGAENDGVVRVGDTITYQLTLTLREGLTRNVTIQDALDPGLAFVEVVSINGDEAAPYVAVAPFSHAPITGVPTAGETGTLTWTLGDIGNAVDNDPSNDTFVIIYRARVQHGANEAPAPTPTTTQLNNQATLGYTYADGVTPVPLDPDRMQDSASAEVRQPEIAAVTKTGAVLGPFDPVTGGNGSEALPYVVDIVANSMAFTLEACNDGDAPAYGVVITDLLASQLNDQSISTPVVAIGASTLVAGVDYTYEGPAARGGELRFTLNESAALDPGACVTITYEVGFYNDVGPNQLWANSATVDEYWSLPPNNAREYVAITPVLASRVWMTNAIVSAPPAKILSAPASGEATVGETVTYQITVPAEPTGAALDNVVITDTLDARLEYVSATPISGPAITNNSVAPDQVSFAVDQIPAGEQVVIQVTARVVNSAATQASETGGTIQNFVSYTYDGNYGGASDPADATLRIVEPVVTVGKAVAPMTSPSAGDTLTYTLTLTALGGAANDIYSNAYDVSIVDTLNLGLAYVPNSATVNGNPINPSTNGADGIAAAQVLTWNVDSGVDLDILEGTNVIVSYQVQVLDNVGANQTLRNDVRIEWTSLNGPSDYERNGTETPAYNDYFATASTELVTPTPGALSKQNPATPTVAIGQPFTYTIVVPEVAATTALHDVKIIDNLPEGVEFVAVSKVSTWGTWTPENSGTATNVVITDSNGQGIDIPVGERIEIELTVVLVDDVAVNYSGRTFSNTAHYTYNQINDDPTTEQTGGADSTDDLTIIGPDNLTLEKSGPVEMRPGVPGTFTLNVHNAGTGPAWNLTITDLVPNPSPGGMCEATPTNVTAQLYLNDGVTTVGGPLVEGVDFTLGFTGAPSCTFTITMASPAGAIPANHRLIVTYEALLDSNFDNAAALTNIAGATQWLSADPDGGGQPQTYTRSLTDGTVGTLDHEDAHTVSIEPPVLVFQKTASVTSANPGDTVRYTLRVENVSDIPLNNFSLVDELDRLNAQPLFQAGSLSLVTVPPGADASNTNANGGANGTGLIDIRNLSLAASDGAPGGADELIVEYEVTLRAVIASGTEVLNQAQLLGAAAAALDSDDPNINGADDPNVSGDEDPTRILVTSAPAFRVLKTSQDLSDDPDVLMAGETLRYTITVKNVGTEDAVEVVLRDQIPTHTTYVPNSTMLNGVPVPDPAPGVSALRDGLLINAPGDAPGVMPADPAETNPNVATITFEVVVNINTINGTIISNQGFVRGEGEGSGVTPEQPSDDPNTPMVDDPTRNVVGNVPFVTAQKTVELAVDNSSPGIVDPGDVLRYTITIHNAAATPATQVVFTDAVPANTTYVANSVVINGIPFGPDGGVSPLVAGIAVSSDDLTPPLPGPGDGVLSPGGTATITFEVQVNPGVEPGTIISNQGVVSTDELPDKLTDADGIASNGDQPTEVVVGEAQFLTITKEVAVVGGDVATAGGYLQYTVRVVNQGPVPAIDVVITDDLDGATPGQLTYVDGSGSLNGNTSGFAYSAQVLTGEYSAYYGDLQPGESVVLRFTAAIDPNVPVDTTVVNTAEVSWNSPAQTASASVAVDVGGIPGEGVLNGRVWHDSDFDNTPDTDERLLEGWSVELYRNARLVGTVQTDASGIYQIRGVEPNTTNGDQYELRFRAPGAGPNTASLGYAHSAFTDGPQRILDIVVDSGSNLQDLNLPIQPNGVAYDSVRRTPVAGATLSLLQAATNTPVPDTCFDDTAQQNQVTPADGHYKFDLNFSSPACPPGGDYLISITPPAAGYMPAPSEIIPPASDSASPAFSVPGCLGSADDAVATTPEHCEVQTSEYAPGQAVAARSAGTKYYLHLSLDNNLMPGESQIFNNHIPIDPELSDAVAITKTSGMVNVTRGQLVPYTITINNTLGLPLYDVNLIDRFPPGFKYVEGSARLNGEPLEPELNGLELSWNNLQLQPDSINTMKLLFIVGAGVSEGEYVNRAQMVNALTGNDVSGEARATVRVISDPTFDCTDVIGKVYDDSNLNGYQDENEKGLAGIRLVTARGLAAKTDEHGRFHITCALVPGDERGSNFILKLDERTLPTGYRVTTENPRVQRATRGKMMEFNFGATIHRVVALSLAEGVFERNSVDMRVQWAPRLDMLLEELRKGPAILRLTYLADVEDAGLVKERLAAVKNEISKRWEEENCCYRLTIETETFWRRGAPVGSRTMK